MSNGFDLSSNDQHIVRGFECERREGEMRCTERTNERERERERESRQTQFVGNFNIPYFHAP